VCQGTATENDGSFNGLYEQQFGAPVFQCTDVGTPEFDSSSWSTTSILSDVAAVYTASCFSDDEASQFPTPEECYYFLSNDEPVCSFLACAKFIRGVDPVTRAPIFGEPV
jgi:hypothetical protein